MLEAGRARNPRGFTFRPTRRPGERSAFVSPPTEAGPAQNLGGPVQNRNAGPLFEDCEEFPDRDCGELNHPNFGAPSD